jgi:hypothetical protein
MDHIFAKPNAASMRTDWYSEPKMVSHNQEWKNVSLRKLEWIQANGPEETSGRQVALQSSPPESTLERGWMLLTLWP